MEMRIRYPLRKSEEKERKKKQKKKKSKRRAKERQGDKKDRKQQKEKDHATGNSSLAPTDMVLDDDDEASKSNIPNV
ncbi:hypothetical protein ACE6H2_016405 [Prunus campanulata]